MRLCSCLIVGHFSSLGSSAAGTTCYMVVIGASCEGAWRVRYLSAKAGRGRERPLHPNEDLLGNTVVSNSFQWIHINLD
jgi:hypothetical protein